MPIKREISSPQKDWRLIGGIVQFLIFVLIVYLVVNALKPSETSTIDTSGSAEISVMPDKAYVFLGAEIDANTASESQQKSADIIDAIKLSLSSFQGIKIETASYYVTPIYSYRYETPEITGYKAVHILKITTTDINNTGKIIDAASESGANNVQDIQFALSDEKEKQTRQELLTKAVADAKQKADIIAKEAKVSLKKPVKISESWNYPMPLYRTNAMAESAATQIFPQGLQLYVSVSISWKI